MKKNRILIGAFFAMILIAVCYSCNPKDTPGGTAPDPGTVPVVVAPTDPSVASTVGFFLDNWQGKNFTKPAFTEKALSTAPASNIVEIDASKVIAKVPSSIYGNNSVSFLVNISDKEPLMTYLKTLNTGVIRFPGGGISDWYFWNRNYQDKPSDVPDTLRNNSGQEVLWKWNYWYGKGNPAARANFDDYYALLQKTGAQGMITVNYGYARYGTSADPVAAAAHMAADWVRYDNGRTKYWEVGNENYGSWEAGYRIAPYRNKDGQPEYINGQLYAKHFKLFADSMHKAARETGKTIYIAPNLLETLPNGWLANASKAATDWNRLVLTELKNGEADFYVIHNYYTDESGTNYDGVINSYTKTAAAIDYVKNELAKYGAPVKPVALTEYNIAAKGSMQMASFVNGMHTLLVTAEAIKNNYGAALRWDIANAWDNGNDHGLFNLGDQPGGITKWSPRPPFYYMYYWQKMFGDRMISTTTTGNDILAYGTSFTSGEKGAVIVNRSKTDKVISVSFKNFNIGERVYWYELTGGEDNGDYSLKVFVNNFGPTESAGGPADSYTQIKAFSALAANGIKLNLPARAVIYLVTDKK